MELPKLKICNIKLVVNFRINSLMEIYCQNCGHICHCGEKCEKDYGESQKTVCCTHCRHEESDDSWKDTIEYDLKRQN